MFYNCHYEDLCLIKYAFSNKIFPYDMKTVKISYNFKKNDDLAKDSYQPIIGGSVFLLAPEQFLTFSQFYNFYNTNDNNFPYIMF